jgi:prepilin-type N-terminal cleavage/methylation domain-containing protein
MAALTKSRSHAFTLIELIAVIAVLAVLSVVAVPKYLDYSARARESACRGVLGNVRTAIANFYANSAISGTAAYPTLVQMQTNGTVLQDVVPANPYNNSATIAAAVWATTPPTSGTAGWNYDAASGKFWANSNTTGVTENTW